MSLVLRVYNPETKEVAKTYTAETVDIMFGTIEDIIDVIDLDRLDDNSVWLKVIAMSIKKLRPLLKEVFVGVTDEELKYTKINELVPLFVEVFKFMVAEIKGLGGSNSKN